MIYFLITVGFIAYLELSPGMGNIWYRNNRLMPIGALRVMIYPFKNRQMWWPGVWDINYPVWLIFGYLLQYFVYGYMLPKAYKSI
jgi:hypothetical protein